MCIFVFGSSVVGNDESKVLFKCFGRFYLTTLLHPEHYDLRRLQFFCAVSSETKSQMVLVLFFTY